jgi:hypothetical protein
MSHRFAWSHEKDRASRLVRQRQQPAPPDRKAEALPVPPRPDGVKPGPTALGLAKGAYRQLSAEDREQFKLWLTGGAAAD